MWRRVAVGAVLLVVLAGCGTEGTGEESAERDSPHPPNSVEELAELFDPQLEPMGLRITRGALIDRSDGGYIPSDQGEHLALYVEPIDDADFGPEDYVEGIGTVTALVTPQVFERWSAVESYDICQEPPAEIDERDSPAPYTQVEIDRAAAEAVDWDQATPSTVIGLSMRGEARLIVTPAVSEDPTYQAAVAAV